MLPAELCRRPVGPHLEGLCLYGDRVPNPRGEALVVLDQLPADRLERADGDRQDHLVEVPPLTGSGALERVRVPPQRVRLELELASLGGRLELVPERLARPALEALDALEREVLAPAGGELRLLDHLDPVHAAQRPAALVPAELQAGDRVEELEADAAGAEDLVQRREHRVPHARLHLVHDRSAVAEGEPQQVARRAAGGDVGGGDGAPRVAERDVVNGAQHGRALFGGASEGDLLGAVTSAARPTIPRR